MNSTITDQGVVFSLDPSSGVPFYRQIIQMIEHAILGGRLMPGDRLPTIRALAVDLKINPNTIAKAYGELELRGIVSTQVGNGTFVSTKRMDADQAELKQRIDEKLSRFFRDMTALGLDREQMIAAVREYKE